MNAERYTDRAKGLIQPARPLAMREENPPFTALHLLEVLLDDNNLELA
jgi:ATP-dependent Clp protease ATP-binding subunit ClpB